MPNPTPEAASRPTPHWFELALALRWPGAVVLSAMVLSMAAVQILKQPLPVALPLNEPLPVRLEGSVRVEPLQLPVVRVTTDTALPVSGTVELNKPVAVGGTVSVESIQQPLTLGAVNEAVTVSAPTPLPIAGSVTVDKIGGTIQTQTSVNPVPGLPLP